MRGIEETLPKTNTLASGNQSAYMGPAGVRLSARSEAAAVLVPIDNITLLVFPPAVRVFGENAHVLRAGSPEQANEIRFGNDPLTGSGATVSE